MLLRKTTTLHVRFNGRSEELDLQALNLHDNPSDKQLRAALARHYDCAVNDLADYVIVREPKVIIVRPVAIYG